MVSFTEKLRNNMTETFPLKKFNYIFHSWIMNTVLALSQQSNIEESLFITTPKRRELII